MKKREEWMMKKKWIVLLLVVLGVFLLPQLVMAEAGEGTTGSVHWELSETGKLTITGNGAMGTIWKPGKVNPDEVMEVEIGEGVTRISSNAFSGCIHLTKVTLPSTLIEIQASAFEGCTNLMELTLPDQIDTVGFKAFYRCPAIKYVMLGSTTAKALSKNRDSFRDRSGTCPHLDLIYEVDRQKEILSFNITGADATITDIPWPEGITKIDQNAFENCDQIVRAALPDTIVYIGLHAFRDCAGLKTVRIPDGVTLISSHAFAGCEELETVEGGHGVTEIGQSAFDGCRSLTTAPAFESLVKIGNFAFRGCTSLARLSLSQSSATLTRTHDEAKPTLEILTTVAPAYYPSRLMKWNSSDTKVARVDAHGVVTALKEGTATITCALSDGSDAKAECKIRVVDQKVKKIKLNKKSATLKIRGTLQLAVTKISPADAVNQSVVWASSNKNVATVDGKGKVTARKAGTAVITCTSKDGSKVKAQCQIKVKK